MQADRQPILIGVGQECWRDRAEDRTPLDALEVVARKALSDCGTTGVLDAVDAVVQLPFLLTQSPGLENTMPTNQGEALAARLGVKAAQFTAKAGGNLPQQMLTLAAERLVRGEDTLTLLCGVELLASFLGALRQGQPMPAWNDGEPERAATLDVSPQHSMTSPGEQAHGLFEPINAYPIFESALRHAEGLSVEAHRQRLGELISAMSRVAEANPYAWKPRFVTPEQALSTDNGNRMISSPYTKIMNAIIAVDQAAALVLTTVGKAKALGIDPQRWVYLRGAAHAHDSWYLSERADLHESPALAAVAQAALGQSGLALPDLGYFDLYSCFPSALQVGCRALGLPLDDPRGLTLTGGLMLFGGPGNNYSTHAIVEMVERLRADPGASGLIWANGGYLTKQAVGIYSSRAPAEPWTESAGKNLQAQLDAQPRPQVAEAGSGSLTVEGHTVRFKGDAPDGGIVIGRLEDGRRCMALVEGEQDIQRLLSEDCVARVGRVRHADGVNHFSF